MSQIYRSRHSRAVRITPHSGLYAATLAFGALAILDGALFVLIGLR